MKILQKSRIKDYLLYLPLLPALLILGLLYGGGLLLTLLKSFGTDIFFSRQPTLIHYSTILSSDDFIHSLVYSLRISLGASIGALTAGSFILVIMYLLMLYNKKPYTGYMRFIQSPLLIPYLISAFFIFLLFSQSGIFSRVLHYFGVISARQQFPVLTNDHSGIGIMLTYTWKAAPFVVLMGHPVLLRIDSRWFNAARLLGANSRHFFLDIVLPALGPSLFSSWFIIFGFSFASFEVPYLLGVTYPKALPVLCYEIFSSRSLSDRPQAMALGVIITLITIIIGIAAFYLYRRTTVNDAAKW